MGRLPLVHTRNDKLLISDAVEYLSECCRIEKLGSGPVADCRTFISQAELMKHLRTFTVKYGVEVLSSTRPYAMAFIKCNSREYIERGYHSRATGDSVVVRKQEDFYEFYPALLFKLKKDVGHVLIRPETIAHKVVELFGNIDVDFDECPQFSRRYFAMAEDEDLFRRNVSLSLLKAIGTFKGLQIEMIHKTMMVLSHIVLNTKSLDRMLNVGDKIAASDF